MSLALLAAVLASEAMVLVACIRSSNRHYHIMHPELHLEGNATVLMLWTTLVAGVTGAGSHFLGWALVLLGSAGWISSRLPRLLCLLYLVGGIAALCVYLFPNLQGPAALLGALFQYTNVPTKINSPGYGKTRMKLRRKTLLKYAQKIDCDTLVCFEPENLFYLTGFWAEPIGVLEKNGKTTIIAPELEVGRAKDDAIECHVVTSDRGVGLLSSLVSMLKGKKVCTDCQNYNTMELLKKSIPTIKHSTDPFYRTREVKDESEIMILKKASKILDEMYELCTKKIVKGVRESELQSKLMAFAMEQVDQPLMAFSSSWLRYWVIGYPPEIKF